MDYKNIYNNLDNYLGSIDRIDGERISIESIEEFILAKAQEKNLDIISFGNSHYIKNNGLAKMILHLNLDDAKDKIQVEVENLENTKIIKSKLNLNCLMSAFIINYMIEYADSNFDILLTKNNIHLKNGEFDKLREIIRTDKVVNLNLLQSDCIADEFSALKLFLNQVRVERFIPDYDYQTYRLELSGLSGGHAGEEFDKVKLNSIKLMIGIIRKIRAKVDIDVVSLTGGFRYDYIPKQAQVDFIVNKDFEADLINIFEIVKNEIIEKNLKYEPEMKLSIRKIENRKHNPINGESFNHLASFTELIPTGSYFVNSIDEQTVSSCSLATARSLKNHINMILVLRSLSEESMINMEEKIKLASKISSSILTERFNIGKWKNPDSCLTEAFKKSYMKLEGEQLKPIKTQFSLDSSIIFNDLNVKIISIGVKYKQSDSIYYSSLDDLSKLISLLETVLSEIN
ncbi:hypothetical protein [Anaerococcus marasmi]|uniref:hypothetical protein n=1 Tax=Anaerococcus marasmi TaxID=2057797 RepID=UPI000CF8BB9A|nr:hypothetical protein [Anaerococcus marasmi]